MKFPKRNFDITLYYERISSLLNDKDCAVFIDTNIIAQLYRLNDKARQDFYNWVDSCGDRFHVPAWVVHEYSDKVCQNKTKEYQPELLKIKTYTKEFNNICEFVKGYIGESMLNATIYEGKVEELKNDIDKIAESLKKIDTAINLNIEKHQDAVHKEIVTKFGSKILTSDIYGIISEVGSLFSLRSQNRIPPGYKDSTKEENSIGDYIIWNEILHFCEKNGVKKAIFITRDQKSDIVYQPVNQTIENRRRAGNEEEVKIARNCLVYEFYTKTNSEDFFVIDFKTFVKICASQYRELAKSFQLAVAEEDRECAERLKANSESEMQLETISVESERLADIHEDEEQLYIGTAIIDGQYDSESNIGYMDEFVKQLKTHNWYKQNPAIIKIIKLQQLNDCEDNVENRSSIFVLGRNIVQSAEGASGNAIMYMENISTYIKDWKESFKKALIDGMLFEVFFDSEGHIRPMGFKAEYFEDIIRNVAKLDIGRPYDFINEKLSKIHDRFVPKVGSEDKYDFQFTIDGNGATTHLSCNEQDISNTFKRSWGLNFASVDNVGGALSSYYGIMEDKINVIGVPEDIEYIRYIELPAELPF